MAEADVAIIGSGATGALMAARLGAAGHRVIILESGPSRSLDHMYSSTIWSRRLKWGGSPVESAGANRIAIPFESGWGTGGAALHHYACWFRLHEEDFHRHSAARIAADWPISYADLRPWYDALQDEVGISGDHERERWRPPGNPYPMPALPIFPQGDIIARGFEALDMHVAPLPMAINSVEYRGRPACIQDGWCDAGCPTGALANPIVLYERALKEAGVETRHHATVSRILTDASGKRASGVEYFDEAGALRVLSTNVVVVAAFSVESPRLLLNSASAKHPAGLANSSGQVGRNFMAHGAVNLYALFDEPTYNYLGRTGGQLVNQDRYADAPGGYGSACTWRIGPAFKLGDLGGLAASRGDLYGEPLTIFMKDAATNLGSMTALVESGGTAGNHIELSSVKDRHGIPTARAHHALDDRSLSALARAADEGSHVLKAAKAREIWHAPFRTEHMMGSLRMGADPARSVANGFGQSHDVDNLFIAGPALFPSIGAVNPTFTAVALAARTADYIGREWRAFASATV